MQPIHPYPPAIEEQMQRYYQSLSEKEGRRYAAIEAVKLGVAALDLIGGMHEPIGQGTVRGHHE